MSVVSRAMARLAARSWARALAVAVPAALLIVVSVLWFGGDDEPPASVPASPTADAAATASTTPAPASTLTLPARCHLLDEYHTGAAREAEPVAVKFVASSCASRALAALAGGVPALTLELRRWNDDPALPAPLTMALDPGEERGRVAWSGEVTYPEFGAWHPVLRVAGLEERAGVIAVDPASDGLGERPGLPATALPGEQVVVTLGGDERARWPAAGAGGTAWLDGPARAVFVQMRNGAAWVVAGDPTTGEVEPLFEAGVEPVVLAGSPAGNAFAVFASRAPYTLRVYSAADGVVREVETDPDRYPVVSWSPDGETLIVVDSWVRVLRGDGRLLSAHGLTYDGGGTVLWAPTNDFALVRMWNDVIYRVNAGAPDLVPVFDRRGQLRVEDVAIAQDGSRVAILYMNTAEQVRRIAVVPADAPHIDDALASRAIADFPFDEHQGWMQSLAWSPDGRSLALATGELVRDDDGQRLRSALIVVDAESGEVRELRADAESFYLWAVSWSEDGRAVYAGRSSCYACDGGVAGFDLVNASTGAIIGTIEGGYPIAAAGDARIVTAGQLFSFDRSGRARVLVGGAGGSVEVRGVSMLPRDLVSVAVGPGRGAVLTVDPGASGDPRPALLGAIDWTVEPVDLLDEHTLLGMSSGLARYDLVTGERVPFNPAADGTVSVSPDRTHAVVIDRGGPAVVRLFALPSGERIPLSPRIESPRAASPAWTADASRLVLADGTELVIVDLAPDVRVTRVDLEIAGIPPDRNGEVRPLALAWADAAHVDVVVDDGIWRLAAGATGPAVRLTPLPASGLYGAAVLSRSPDGGTLALVTAFGAYALDEAAGTWRELARVGTTDGWAPSWGARVVWAPDSSALAFSARSANRGEDLGIVVAPVDASGAYRLVAPPSSRLVWPLAWLPDGRVVYAAWVQGI